MNAKGYARLAQKQCKHCKCYQKREQPLKGYVCMATNKKAHKHDKACNKFIHKFSE